jgi:hypothetical protein
VVAAALPTQPSVISTVIVNSLRTASHANRPLGFCGLATGFELADPVQQLAHEHGAGVVEPKVTP